MFFYPTGYHLVSGGMPDTCITQPKNWMTRYLPNIWYDPSFLLNQLKIQ